MKKILTAGCAFLFATVLHAQQKQGTVIYERVSQFQARFNINGQENVMQQTRKDKFELTFGNNQSLWKQAEQENNDDGGGDAGGGMQIKMVVAGSDDVTYCNFDDSKRTDLRMMLDKKFIVDDSIRNMQWKLS